MHLNPFMGVLGVSGGELVIILTALLVLAAITIGAIVLVVWLTKRDRKPPSPQPPVIPPPTKRICLQCRSELGADAPQGLCPQCLAKAAFETQAAGMPEQRTSALPISEIAKCFPQFEILELLGQGGMGMVYKARQPQLDRFVALKILSPDLSRDPAFAERFAREARALAKLNHPNIVAVYESGKAGDFYYLAMEYVDGLNLSQMQTAKKRLRPEDAFAIVPKICDALQYAHDEGVVHRDIKPANILIDTRGRVKIADFGLAKIAGKEVAGLGLTQTRATMGTPQYMAPEQLEKPLEVDHRADIYSLGVVFYEMLTGELPLGRFPVPSKKVQVDVRLDEIVLRTLEKEPELRYQQASQIKSDVQTVVSTPGTQSAPNPSASAKPTAEPTPWWAQPKQIPDWKTWANHPAGSNLSLLAIIAVICAGCAVITSLTQLRSSIVTTFAVATTVLGWISVSQIRHSNGKLRGLGLAVFAGLVFPLLLLDFAIVMVPLRFTIIDSPGNHMTRVAYPYWVMAMIVLAGGFAVVLDWIIATAVWRAVRIDAGTPKSDRSAEAGQHRWRWFGVAMLVAVVAIVAVPISYLFAPHAIRVVDRSMPAVVASDFAKVRLSIFKEEGSAIDALIPIDQRTAPDQTNSHYVPRPYEVILTDETTFNAVTNRMSRPPGMLGQQRQTINQWPRQSFFADFTNTNDVSEGGSVVGWMGVRKGTNELVVRLEENVSYHNASSHGYVRVTSERPVPSSAKLLVLVPRITPDQQTYYLVLAYEIDQVQPPSAMPSVVAIGRPDQTPYQWWNAQGQPLTPKDEWLAHSASAALAVIVDRHKIDGMLDVEIKTPGTYRHGGANDTGNAISDVDGVDGPHMRYTATTAAGTGIGEGCTLEYLTDNVNGELRKYLDAGGPVDVIITYGVGKWQEVTKIQANTMVKTNGGYFRFGKVDDNGGDLLIDCIYDFDPAYEISFVGVDKNGNWYRTGDSFGGGQYSSRENRRFYGSIRLAKSQLSNFLILKRPVTRTVIESIPTKPFASSVITNPAADSRIRANANDVDKDLMLASSYPPK